MKFLIITSLLLALNGALSAESQSHRIKCSSLVSNNYNTRKIKNPNNEILKDPERYYQRPKKFITLTGKQSFYSRWKSQWGKVKNFLIRTNKSAC